MAHLAYFALSLFFFLTLLFLKLHSDHMETHDEPNQSHRAYAIRI